VTKEGYFKFQDEYFDSIKTLTKKKNADYTGLGEDPFKNFKHVGSYDESWILIGFFTRMSDKFARVASYIQKGKFEVEDEGIMDTLKDLSNYPCLLAGYLKSKNEGETYVIRRVEIQNEKRAIRRNPNRHTKNRANGKHS
jgi:hypothetical protein